MLCARGGVTSGSSGESPQRLGLAQRASGGGRVTEIAVVAEKMPKIMPCGGCRQRLAEFATEDAVLHLCDTNGVLETVPFSAVFPRGFSFEDGK